MGARALGPDHISVLVTRGTLATCLERLALVLITKNSSDSDADQKSKDSSDFKALRDEALALYRRGSADAERTLGKYHMNTGFAYTQLATSLLNLCDPPCYEEAIENFVKSFECHEGGSSAAEYCRTAASMLVSTYDKYTGDHQLNKSGGDLDSKIISSIAEVVDAARTKYVDNDSSTSSYDNSNSESRCESSSAFNNHLFPQKLDSVSQQTMGG